MSGQVPQIHRAQSAWQAARSTQNTTAEEKKELTLSNSLFSLLVPRPAIVANKESIVGKRRRRKAWGRWLQSPVPSRFTGNDC